MCYLLECVFWIVMYTGRFYRSEIIQLVKWGYFPPEYIKWVLKYQLIYKSSKRDNNFIFNVIKVLRLTIVYKTFIIDWESSVFAIVKDCNYTLSEHNNYWDIFDRFVL